MDDNRLKGLLDSLISGVCAFSYDTSTGELSFEYMNEGSFRMLGTTRAIGERYIARNVREMILPQDLKLVKQWLSDIIADNGDVETIFRYVTFQGAPAHMRVKGNLYERDGSLNRIVCTFSDCTEEISMQHETEKQLQFMNSIVESRRRFDYQLRTDTCVVRDDPSGDDGNEVLLPHFLDSAAEFGVHPEDAGVFMEAIRRAMRRQCKDQIEYRAREINGTGEYRWHQCNLMSITGNEGYVTHVLGLVLDINDRKLEEQKLQLKADTDSLTQLLNKGATEALIRSEIDAHHGDRHMDALMVIDVDDFKYINDHFGHMIGDRVLHFVGDSLKQNLKGMDVAGRIGGDEFMVFLQNIKSAHDTEAVASHIQEVIHGGYGDDEVARHLSVSIGIAIGQDTDENYEELFREADDALYETKHNGKASFTLFHGDQTKSG